MRLADIKIKNGFTYFVVAILSSIIFSQLFTSCLATDLPLPPWYSTTTGVNINNMGFPPLNWAVTAADYVHAVLSWDYGYGSYTDSEYIGSAANWMNTRSAITRSRNYVFYTYTHGDPHHILTFDRWVSDNDIANLGIYQMYFIYLSACQTTQGPYLSNAFHIYGGSLNKALLGYKTPSEDSQTAAQVDYLLFYYLMNSKMLYEAISLVKSAFPGYFSNPSLNQWRYIGDPHTVIVDPPSTYDVKSSSDDIMEIVRVFLSGKGLSPSDRMIERTFINDVNYYQEPLVMVELKNTTTTYVLGLKEGIIVSFNLFDQFSQGDNIISKEEAVELARKFIKPPNETHSILFLDETNPFKPNWLIYSIRMFNGIPCYYGDCIKVSIDARSGQVTGYSNAWKMKTPNSFSIKKSAKEAEQASLQYLLKHFPASTVISTSSSLGVVPIHELSSDTALCWVVSVKYLLGTTIGELTINIDAGTGQILWTVFLH